MKYDSLLELIKAFPDEETCVKHLENLRWPKGIVCPCCGSTRKIYKVNGISFTNVLTAIINLVSERIPSLKKAAYHSKNGSPHHGYSPLTVRAFLHYNFIVRLVLAKKLRGLCLVDFVR